MSSPDDFKNENGKVSISSFGEANTISQLDSLEVILKDSKGNDLTKATLNEYGHFLFGNEKNTLDEKFTKEITEGNNSYYNKLIVDKTFTYNSGDNGLLVKKGEGNTKEKFQVGDIVKAPADGDFSKINTNSFVVRTEASNGATAKTKSAWNFDKVSKEQLGKVDHAAVKYTVDGKTYQVKVN